MSADDERADADAARKAVSAAAFTDKDIEVLAGVVFSYFQGYYHHDKEPIVAFDLLRDALKFTLKEWPDSDDC